MRSMYGFVFLLLAVANGAQMQMPQGRSPVYSSTTSAGVTPQPLIPKSAREVNSQSAPAAPITPMMNNGQGQPSAQPREGNTGQTETLQSTPNAQPSQNYLVYYYPDQAFRTGAQTTAGGTSAATGYGYATPEATSAVSTSPFQRTGWTDAGAVALTLVAVIGGGTLIYQGLGQTLKARTFRAMQELTAEDLNHYTTKFLKAMQNYRQ